MSARKEILKNDPATTLAEDLDNSETTVTVTNGAVFPSTGDFRVRVNDEIMLVTARSTNDLTVVRGAEGTAATTHTNGDDITQILTEDGLERYLRDNDPLHNGGRPPYRIVDGSNVALDSSDFTEVNGNTNPTPVDNADGTITVIKSSGNANPDWSLYARTEPSLTATIVANLRFMGATTGSGSLPGFGIGFRESSTGEFVVIMIRTITGADNMGIGVAKYTNATTLSAFYDSGPFQFVHPRGDGIWFKIVDNNTNLIFSYSMDGVNYVTLATKSRTDFMGSGPDQIVWGVNNENNVSHSVVAQLCAWDEAA